MVVYASTFMVVALSIDRVDAIARPMNFTRKGKFLRVIRISTFCTGRYLVLSQESGRFTMANDNRLHIN